MRSTRRRRLPAITRDSVAFVAGIAVLVYQGIFRHGPADGIAVAAAIGLVSVPGAARVDSWRQQVLDRRDADRNADRYHDEQRGPRPPARRKAR